MKVSPNESRAETKLMIGRNCDRFVQLASQFKKKSDFILRALISAALIGLVVRKLDWAAVWINLGRADWRLLSIAAVLPILPIFILSVRWHLFIRQQGISVSAKNVFFLTWAGQFFNSVLPGSTGGDFVKIFHLCRIAPDHRPGAVASVVVDRLTALAALLVLAVISLIRQPIPRLPEGWSIPSWLSAGAAGITMFAVVVAFLLRHRLPVRMLLSKFLDALKIGLKPGIPLAAGFALSFAIHLFCFFHFFLLAYALGLRISYSDTLIIMPVLLLLMLVPITVNGHGLRELILIYYFQALDLLPASGAGTGTTAFVISLSMLIIANDLLWSLPGGIFYMLRFRKIR